MSAGVVAEELTRLRRLLVRAASDEHRLHQQAARELQAEQRWRERADLAGERGLSELVTRADERAALHRERAAFLAGRYEEHRRWVEQLRRIVRQPELVASLQGRFGVAELDPELVGRYLAEIEEEARLEQDLAELKGRMRATIEPPTAGDSPAVVRHATTYSNDGGGWTTAD